MTARLFPRSIRTVTALGAVAALTVAAAPATASGEDEVGSAVAAKAVEAGVRIEALEARCAEQGLDPEQCIEAYLEDDAPPLPQDPPPADPAPEPMEVPPGAELKVPTPGEQLLDGARNGERPLLAKCRCKGLKVGVARRRYARGVKAGQVRSVPFDTMRRTRAGFTLKWRLECGAGIDPVDCAGEVKVLSNPRVRVHAATRKVACKGECVAGAEGQLYVRLSGGPALTARRNPVRITVRHKCANGRVLTTKLRFVFDAQGHVDRARSDLGADL
jgi:hypothetical protein